MKHLRCPFAFSLVAACVVGCGSETMIPTPYVMYGAAGSSEFAQVPERFRTPDMPVVYVTDREVTPPESSEAERAHGPRYGYARCTSMAFGVAHVSPGVGATWDQLVADSIGEKRSRTYYPFVSQVEEVGAFSPVASYLEPKDGHLALVEGAFEKFRAEQSTFNDLLDRWLDVSQRKEAVVFIHGFNNTFDDAVLRLAQAWHFSGRRGVPIVFTWPAGIGGLRGYAYDRESGEFCIVHLKALLMALASNPKIEKIHIISHSRGTDVATTALRELNAEIRGSLGLGMTSRLLGLPGPLAEPSGETKTTADVLKLQTLVLAAPDLDIECFTQRFVGENLLSAAHRVVLYFSTEDNALLWADWLFLSRQRLGSASLSDFTPQQREKIAKLSQFQAIDCKVRGHSSHSYIMQHPAALSDLILLLRDDAPPGPAGGRPLLEPYPGLWELDNDYLKPSATAAPPIAATSRSASPGN